MRARKYNPKFNRVSFKDLIEINLLRPLFKTLMSSGVTVHVYWIRIRGCTVILYMPTWRQGVRQLRPTKGELIAGAAVSRGSRGRRDDDLHCTELSLGYSLEGGKVSGSFARCEGW